MKRALITGAGGSLGRALAARLASSETWTIVNTSRRVLEPGYIELDVRCLPSVTLAIERYRPEVVFHLAASFSEDFNEAYGCNVLGAHNLLAAIAVAGTASRLLLIGTAAEYGLVYPSENPITERQPLRPMTVYGLTKAWQTQLGLMHARHGADVVVARLFNLLADGLSDRLFIGRVQQQISAVERGAQSSIEVGPLDAVRDYITDTNAVDQILAIAELGSAGGIYNVGSGQPICIRDILTQMLHERGLQMCIVREQLSASTHHGYDVPVAYADMDFTGQLLKRWSEHDHD